MLTWVCSVDGVVLVGVEIVEFDQGIRHCIEI